MTKTKTKASAQWLEKINRHIHFTLDDKRLYYLYANKKLIFQINDEFFSFFNKNKKISFYSNVFIHCRSFSRLDSTQLNSEIITHLTINKDFPFNIHLHIPTNRNQEKPKTFSAIQCETGSVGWGLISQKGVILMNIFYLNLNFLKFELIFLSFSGKVEKL